MKPFKFALRLWITVSSVLVFLVSWVILGHSPKPINARQTTATALPTLEPLPPMGLQNFDTDLGPRILQSRPSRSSFFVTGGS